MKFMKPLYFKSYLGHGIYFDPNTGTFDCQSLGLKGFDRIEQIEMKIENLTGQCWGKEGRNDPRERIRSQIGHP